MRQAFLGTWKITKMENWDQEAVDLVGPGRFRFDKDDSGEIHFIAVDGWLDYRYEEREGKPAVEFSWDGTDEGDEIMGRGWAILEGADEIRGHLFIHRGDDSMFKAKRQAIRGKKKP